MFSFNGYKLILRVRKYPYIIFKVLDKVHGLRVPARIEEEGLDIYEHGESAYNH
jgi:ammonia channel protein AmtB